MRFNQTLIQVLEGNMAWHELLAETARRERLQEWIEGLEKRLSVERRFKVQTALRREIEKCKECAIDLDERIAELESDESASQAS